MAITQAPIGAENDEGSEIILGLKPKFIALEGVMKEVCPLDLIMHTYLYEKLIKNHNILVNTSTSSPDPDEIIKHKMIAFINRSTLLSWAS